MEKAEKDLLAAEINLQEGLYEVSAFLSHQAAEKALKACEDLNRHYIETRYPTEVEYTEEVARDALEKAKKVVKWVKRRIRKRRN